MATAGHPAADGGAAAQMERQEDGRRGGDGDRLDAGGNDMSWHLLPTVRHRHTAAARAGQVAKDFSVLPTCSGVRPVASQLALARRASLEPSRRS